MKPNELLEVFRDMVDDTVEEYFLSDSLFYIYLTDSIVQYCKYGRGIRDHTSPLTVLDYTAGNPWVNLDEKIIKVIEAFDEGNNNKRLSVKDWESFAQGNKELTTDYGIYLGTVRYPDQEGVITTVLTGFEDDKLRLVNIPAINGTLKLIIERYPLNSITETNQKIEGVPVNDRLILLEWVKYKYYSKQDAETFDPDRAELSRLTFLSELRKVDSKDMIKTKKRGSTGYGGI